MYPKLALNLAIYVGVSRMLVSCSTTVSPALFLTFYFGTWFLYVAQAGLQLLIFLHQSFYLLALIHLPQPPNGLAMQTRLATNSQDMPDSVLECWG